MCVFVWVASETALLAWLQRKREGHVGEWCLTAKMIHGGMYAWHTLAAGMMDRAQLLWGAFSLLDGQALLMKGGKCSSVLHSYRNTLLWCEGTGQVGLLSVSWVSQSIMLTFIEHLLCTHAKLFQWCPTLCNLMDCSPILQTKILEWVAVPFPRGSSRPRDWTCLLHWQVGFFHLQCHLGFVISRYFTRHLHD